MPVFPGSAADYVPVAENIHDLLPLRVMWTATTRPSLADVNDIIARRAATLAAEFPILPDEYLPVARAHLAYAAAAQVETTYYPEQQFGDGGQAKVLDLLAGAELTRLRTLMGKRSTGLGFGTIDIQPWCVP